MYAVYHRIRKACAQSPARIHRLTAILPRVSSAGVTLLDQADFFDTLHLTSRLRRNGLSERLVAGYNLRHVVAGVLGIRSTKRPPRRCRRCSS